MIIEIKDSSYNKTDLYKNKGSYLPYRKTDERNANLIFNELYSLIKKTSEYIQREIPEYTNHGLTHIDSMISYLFNIDEILKEKDKFIKSAEVEILHDENRIIPLSEFELDILYCAILLHDIGNLHCRSIHNIHSYQFLLGEEFEYSHFESNVLEEIKDGFNNSGLDNLDIEVKWEEYDFISKKTRKTSGNFLQIVAKVCLYHTILPAEQKQFIMKMFESEICEDSGYLVIKLTTILRFIDLLDITKNRTPNLVYTIIKESLECYNRFRWEAHIAIDKLNITNVPFSNRDVRLEVRYNTSNLCNLAKNHIKRIEAKFNDPKDNVITKEFEKNLNINLFVDFKPVEEV